MDARAEAQQSFGDWLRQRRLELDLTREDFARRVGCSTITLRKLEAEERRPSRQMAERLAEVLNVAPDDLPSFLQFSRGDPFSAPPASASPAPLAIPALPAAPVELADFRDLTDSDNPYKGLRAFGEGDAADFFGREALTQQLLARLSESGELARFLAVVGPSGSGKSSVVRAGLVHALRRGGLPGSDQWVIVQLLPGAHPLEELEAALLRIAVNPPESLMGQLREDTRGLARAARRCLPDDPAVELVLVIDQFEEIFTLLASEAERAHLLDSLVSAVLDERSRLRIVITLRGDFVDRPFNYLDFGDLLRQRMEVVLPLSPDELERAIVGPADRLGLHWETGLVSAVIYDVANEPGALPLLQFALTRLFEKREGQQLTRAAYDAVGGVLGALGQRAEEVFARLDQIGQALARQMFLRLVTLGEGVEDTRRRVLRSELEALGPLPPAAPGDVPPDPAPVKDPAIEGVLETFGGQRLLSFDRDQRTLGPTVEVAHESLLREWPRLREWLTAGRADVRLQRQLAAAADDWQRANHDPSYLLIGSRLAQFEDWSTNTDILLTLAETQFIQSSLDQRQAQQRAEAERQGRELAAAHKLAEAERQRADAQSRATKQLRRRALYLTGAFVLALVMAGTAVFFGQQARLNAVAAQQNASAAQQNAVAAQQNASAAQQSAADSQNIALVSGSQAALASGDTDAALALAMQAVQLNPSSTRAQVALGEAAYSPGTVRRFVGHTWPVQVVIVSPDGRTVLSGDNDGVLILWDLASGRIVRRFVGDAGVVDRIVFSPDGHSALSGAFDGLLILWDVDSGTIIREFAGLTTIVQSVALSPDGRTALSGQVDGTLFLWDVPTGQRIRSLVGHTGAVNSVVFSPNGRTALSGADDHSVVQWDVATGSIVRRFMGHNSPVGTVALSPDGQTALSGATDSVVIQWDMQTGQIMRRLYGHGGWVTDIHFSPDGQQALSSGTEGTAILWDLASGQAIAHLVGRDVNSVAYTPDGQYALGTDGKDFRLWELQAGQVIRRFDGKQDWVTQVALSPDGRTALSSARDGTVNLWDMATGQTIRRFTNPQPVNGVAFTPDGRSALLALGYLEWASAGNIVLWNTETGQEIRRYNDVPSAVGQVAVSPDGRTVAAGGDQGYVILWDAATGKVHRFLAYGDNTYYGNFGAATALAFSPDGLYLLTGFTDGQIMLWDVATGVELGHLIGHTDLVSGITFSRDGRMALSAAFDNTVIEWDMASRQILHRFTDHSAAAYAPAISPDGRLGFAGSADKTGIVWDLQTGQVVRRYSGLSSAVTSAAFELDGRSLLVGFVDGSLSLWRIDTTLDDLLAWIHANRYVPDLTCEQRTLYRLTPACGVSGVSPAPTP